MLGKDEVIRLAEQAAVFWAANWDRANSVSDPRELYIAGGDDRLDEITARIGYDVGMSAEIGDWKRFVKYTAILASELRFRIFKDRERAAHAALNVAESLLDRAGFRPRDSNLWGTFNSEFLKCLFNPRCYDKELAKCISRHLVRKPVE